jgi:citrate synthase
MMPKTDANLERWSRLAEAGGVFDQELYEKFDVKRGLRDESGRGVVAGLTQIGDVVGYATERGTSHPAPGELLYRGIEITDLVAGFAAEDRQGFEEAAYLLLFGQLPDADELRTFEQTLASYRKLPRTFVHDSILRVPSNDVMNALARIVLSLYTLDKRAEDTSVPNVLRQSLHLISKFPMLSVYAYQAYLDDAHGRSLVIHRPLPELSTAENFLHMLRPDSKYTALEATLLDLTLVLHAEHGGGNNSSFTTHVVSSTGTDTYSTIAAALGSLKGPRHGGANIKAAHMLDDLMEHVGDWEDEDEIEAYLLRVLDKDAFDRTGLIYGMGHPVYSISDPRAIILRKYAEKLAGEKGLGAEYRLHERVERLAPEVIASTRTMFKGVSSNVDFYSGFVYRMLEIPEELFTPLFAVSRVVGWCAHRIEEIAGGGKIIRPAYKAVAPRGKYVPMGERRPPA